MKRFVKYFVLLVAVVLVTGCGKESAKESVKTCKLVSNDIANGYKLESEYKIYSTGKTVDKVVTVETVTSEDESVLDYFNEYLDTTYKTYNETYGGYTNKITKDSGKVVSETTIDYSAMDLKKYVSDNSSMANFVNSDNKLLTEGVVSIYETLGATCE